MTLPNTLDIGFGTIAELIATFAKEAPDRKALIDGDRELSYGELDALMDSVATKLLAEGLAPRDVIAVCAISSLEYVAVFLGALRVGITVAPLAPSSTPDSLASMIADSGAKILFLDATTAASLTGIKLPRVALDDTSVGQAFSQWHGP